ncbi:Zinc finger protein C25B8.19c [Leucoagaricus sp. SymC.cos]|nr:Zinc finger protein C25B8.19c [Leucoagaricus sp. SymC.cos]
MHLSPTQVSGLPTTPNPADSAHVHGLDSPPALVQAVTPWVIATNLDVGQIYEDDERTPIARPFDVGPMGRPPSHAVSLGRFFDDGTQPPLGKYDCKFCGKLFNRPSSLRVNDFDIISEFQQSNNQQIHLNSHTGEKPFICPHPDCGRSFSVLSNMRRHARVHMNNSKEQGPEESNDETSSQPSPTIPSTPRLSNMSQETAPRQALTRSQTHCKQDSNVSESSSSSRRSRNTSSDDGQMEEVEKPDKRSRHRPG